MSQRIHTSGSSFPELKEDTLRLYSNRICPYTHRARLVVAHKNIPHEVINIGLKDKPEWYLERAPLGKVPVIEHDGKVITESTAVCDYLDDVFPGDKLQPSDPYRKAMDRVLLEQFGQLTSTGFYPILFSFKSQFKDAAETALNSLNKSLKWFEEQLTERDSVFFGGSNPAMIDLLMWPHMERIPVVGKLNPKVTLSDFPKLSAWWDAMTHVPAVKKEFHDTEWHMGVMMTLKDGKAAGDYGLDD